MTKNGGFSLVELLLYVAILAIVAGLFIGILITTTRIQVNESVNNEIANQLNFVMQTIQRLVRESSAIIVSNANPCTNAGDDDSGLIGNPQPCLKLRMKDSQGGVTDRDPIIVWKDSLIGAIKIQQGVGVNQTTSELTTDKTRSTDNSLTFTKFTNYPGHDSVQIDLSLTYKGSAPAISRRLQTVIGRVSAATFDSSLLPDQNNQRDIGNSSTAWKDAYFKGNVTIDGILWARLSSGTGDPLAADCDGSNDTGRLYLKTGGSTHRLFICTTNGSTWTWRSVNL